MRRVSIEIVAGAWVLAGGRENGEVSVGPR